MKLTPAKINSLAHQMAAALRESRPDAIADEARVAAVLRHTLEENLRAEDAIEEEARALLRRHASQIHGENLDYNLLFQRAKRQIAAQKKFIL